MGDTSIQWTDKTWNPVTGCTKVSTGCKNCYAERVFPRVYGSWCVCGHAECAHMPECRTPENDGCKQYRQRKFTDVRCHEDRLEQPLHWRKPLRIFVNSMSDLFHEDVPFEFIDRVFAVMALCPQHTFQILTKRPDRMREYLSQDEVAHHVGVWVWEYIEEHVDPLNRRSDDLRATALDMEEGPLPNVWLGVSVEDQKTADERIPLLLATPAAIRFVSYEPALGPVEFDCGPGRSGPHRYFSVEVDHLEDRRLDWVIIGGESGPRARPFNINWARDVIRQCKSAGVACFVKQIGANPYACRESNKGKPDHPRCIAEGLADMRDGKGGDPDEWTEDLRVRQFPEVAA